MRIANNAMAINTHRQYTMNNASVANSTEKLSSGYRINRAGDDAAGLAISEKMRAQIKGLNMASKNSQDAISLIQTAEGALTETHSILQRMRELSVQSASDTNDEGVDRAALNEEFQALKKEIDDISTTTKFNGKKLLDGTYTPSTTTTTYSAAPTGLAGGITATGSAAGTLTIANTTVSSTDGNTFTFATSAGTATINRDDASFTVGGVTFSGLDAAKWATVDDAVDALGGPTVTQSGDTGSAVTITEANVTADYTLAESDVAAVGAVYSDTMSFTIDGHTVTIGTDTTVDLADGVSVTLGSSVWGSMTTAAGLETGGDANKIAAALDELNTALFGTGTTFSVDYEAGPDITEQANAAAGALQSALFTGGSASIVVTEGTTTVPGQEMVIQTGADINESLKVGISAMGTTALEIGDATIANRTDASDAIESVNNAINTVSTQRAKLGAYQNRLQHKINNLDTSAENLQSAESRIRDLDMAKEMTNYTKNNILVQASTAMLAQANAAPQGVLQLLQ